jgi:hypothetical protein
MDVPLLSTALPIHHPPVPSSGTLHGIVFSSAGGADQLQGFGKADQIVRQMELFQGHLSGCYPLVI